ncbi:hypothetical protein [Tunicatimonas pelagia]|uniref:hypothetical protein n=1 Tax=Tunicatimonas pelagia TaxID=931531 RepID=UPI002665475E|nr:hypothetical protein [Tunicatimonas pelagia]WKN45344.1 hypothetical protein P0M28_10270 [Tunicatimonas pelagia]
MKAWDTISNRWLKSKTVAGVHARWAPSQECTFSVCVLEQRKQMIQVVTKRAGIKRWEELTEYIAPHTPIHLTVEGKGILVRKVAEDSQNYLSEIIPDARLEDFYAIRYSGQWVGIARRSVVDKLLERFNGHHRWVLSVQLGPFSLNTILPYLSQEITALHLPFQNIDVADQQLQQIHTTNEHDHSEARYTIGDEVIPSRDLLAYATALSYFIPVEGNLPQQATQAEFKQRQIFTKSLPVILGFFLLVLLINSVVYFRAFQQNELLVGESVAHQSVLQKLTTLQQEVAEKEAFLTTLNWENSRSKASLADRLAATVPNDIVLTQLHVSPLDENRYRKDKRKVFDSSQLRITGHCHDMVVLNRWLSELEQQPWVAKLQNQQYTADASREAGEFMFTLLLQP